MADQTQTALPSASPQTYQVFDENDVKGKFVGDGNELLAWMKERPGRTLALHVKSPDGQTGTQRADKFKPLQDEGWRVIHDDATQVPAVYELSKQLQDRDPDALERFLAPFWDAVVAGTPDYLKELRLPTMTELLKSPVVNPSYALIVEPLKQVIDIPHKWTQAAKAPTSGETTTEAISALPVPFAPEIAHMTQDATTDNIAGALGNAGLAGGMLFLQNLMMGAAGGSEPGTFTERGIQSAGKFLHENVTGPAEAKTPSFLIGTKRLENLGFQREVMSKLNQVSDALNPDDLKGIREAAGAEVRSADEQNQAAKQFEQDFNERSKRIADIDKATQEEVQKRGQVAAEQTRRSLDLKDLGDLATEVAGPRKLAPIQQAEHVMEVAAGVKGATDEVESALYEPVRKLADARDVHVDLAPVGRTIAAETKYAMPSQHQLGTSSIPARTLEGAAKMESGTTSRDALAVLEAINHGDVGTLTANQRDALQSVVEAGETNVPFGVADEAQRGLGSILRAMKKRNDPKLAPEIRLLSQIQRSIKGQIDVALDAHPDILEIYDHARRVTTEQHDVIDAKYIQSFFSDPRYKLAGEALVKALLSRGTERLQGAVLKSLDVGPNTLSALDRINRMAEEDGGEAASQRAASISKRIADTVAPSTEAKAGLRRLVVDQMVHDGTIPSKTAGVTAPSLDYNRMIKFLEDRPGAKILLGDGYERLVEQLRAKADAKLRLDDPDYHRFIQKEAARYEVRRTLAKAPEGAEEVAKEMPEADFLKKVETNQAFRRGVIRNASPDIRAKIQRGIIKRAIDGAMEQGASPESPDGIISIPKFGRNLAEAADALSELGNRQAVLQLQGLGRAAERATTSASVGVIPRVYGFFTGIFGRGARASVAYQEGPFKVGPRQVLKEIGLKPVPVTLPDVPRSLDADIFRASQDPELARLMRKTLETNPKAPGAGIQVLKYYLGFAGGRGDEGKQLDDKTAQYILDQTGGNIDDAVQLAEHMGYTR